jgi:hypothetical protein
MRRASWLGLLVGGLLALQATGAAARGEVVKYTYDALGRLTVVTRGATITYYDYDAAGNRIRVSGPTPPPAPTGPTNPVLLQLLTNVILPAAAGVTP